jgi:tetratricopeptide (TPR) repeat protein
MSQEINNNRTVANRREIRVFISSTFRDMQEEREELVKRIFPQLRRLCESRGVTWGDVDLRWGVTDEAKAEGKVLPLCLEEIEQCRPYFIGILGERYGWVNRQIPESLFETQPWLKEHLDQSVTALEILHGVLNDPAMARHAFFYFRDPACAAQRPGFVEEDPALRPQLVKLKDDIRSSSFPVSEPFATPKQLGEWVLRDLTAVIEELYPEKTIPIPLDRTALDHEAYAASRRTVYIGRDEYRSRLDAHAAADGPPLVIAGQSGGGKSALLANWTHTWSEDHPETPILVHFIGAAPDSADWMAMLRRLLGEFERKFGIEIETPDQPDALRAAFANALHMVSARGRVVLVLDALNQIEDRDGALDLVWLPPVIPANVRLIVSTLPGRAWDDLKNRAWPVMTVEPLTTPERERLIVDYLARYSKALSPAPTRRIAAAPQTGNGLYLSTLLNELRLFGSHEQLDQRIDWYLEATTPIELYRKVIERWEQDYGQPDPACPNVVRESLVCLWAARRGLSETELLESLGTAGSPLPRAIWSPLYLAAGHALLNRGGLLTFAHEFLREAVREAYLTTPQIVDQVHVHLADYFEWTELGDRKACELPWHLLRAREWERLVKVLTDLPLLNAVSYYDATLYWQEVEGHSNFRANVSYGFVLERPENFLKYIDSLAYLLGARGYPVEGASLLQVVAMEAAAEEDLQTLARTLGNLAAVLSNTSYLDEAVDVCHEQVRISHQNGDNRGQVWAQSTLGMILEKQAQYTAAMQCLEQAVEIARIEGFTEHLANALNNLGAVYFKMAQLLKLPEMDGALAAIKDTLLDSSGDRKSSFDVEQLLDQALVFYQEVEALSVQKGDMIALYRICNNEADVLHQLGRSIEALEKANRADRICRELGTKLGLVRSLHREAEILHAQGGHSAALAILQEQEQICRNYDLPKAMLQAILANQGILFQDSGRLNDALEKFREQARICREAGIPTRPCKDWQPLE